MHLKSASARVSQSPPQIRILLVEDEALIALFERQKLEQEGYQVLVAATGEEAVEIVSSNPAGTDLILMDVNLGAGMDGTQAAQAILAEHNIPILFISAHTDKETVEKTEKITSYGYVVKNSSPTVLFASVKMALKLFRANQKIQETEADYRALFENSLDAIGVHEIVLDEQGIPVDYVFLHVNSAFEQHTGLRAADILGQRATDIVAGLRETGLIELYGKVALTGEPLNLETYVESMGSYFSISAFQAGPNRFATVFENITERKLAEKQLKESEERARLIIENTPAGYFRIDRDGNFTEVNQAWLAMHGFSSPKEVLGRHFSLTQTAEDLAQAQEVVSHVLRGGKIPSGEFTRRKKDLSVGHHTYSVTPVVQDGAVVGLEGFLIDTTLQKQAEKALLENEEKFQALFDQAPLGYQSLDENGYFLEVNQAWLDTLGYAREEVIGKWFGDFLAPEYVDAFRKRFPLFKASGQIHSEFQMLHRDGSRRFIAFEGRVGYSESGAFRQTHCILSDITERVRQQDQLRASEEDLRRNKKVLQAIIDNSSTHLVYLDPEFNFVAVNQQYAQTCQRTPDELIGKNHFYFFPHPENEAIFRLARDTGQSVSFHDKPFEFPDQPGRGTTYWDWTLTPILAEDGHAAGLVFSLVETTERVRSEEQIVKLLHEKETLLREIHHRVKNNMFTITSLLELQILAVKEEAAKLALQDAAGRIRSLGILYNRLYRTNDIGSLSLREYLPSLIDAIVDIFPNRKAVKVNLQVEDIPLKVDLLTTLGIILNELVTNAMKYAFLGRERGTLTISAAREAESIAITIADDGVGLPETITFANSTGLGMQIVGILARQLKADITTEHGAGTCYRIRIPIDHF